MSDAAEPPWELLPHDPLGFFALDGDFDRRELKRRYNQLVRRYKPERSPQEFQLIRAAYEELNDALRFNLDGAEGAAPSATHSEATRSRQPFTFDVPLPATNEPPHRETKRPARERERPAAVKPKAASPTPPGPPTGPPPATPPPIVSPLRAAAARYVELRDSPTISADDYLVLALLSDAVREAGVARQANESFLGWLIAGLARHPFDWRLTNVLREYLKSPLDDRETIVALAASARVLPPARFQFATEAAWDRLLRRAPFATYRDCLFECQDRLGRAADLSQIVFLIHVLKFAVWTADDESLARMRETVEDHQHSLPRDLDYEYQIVDWLLTYRQHRREFAARGPICARIDRAIRDWCLGPETEGDLSVLDCHYFISQRAGGLLGELPLAIDELGFVFPLWQFISDDVMERVGEAPDVEVAPLAERAYHCLVQAKLNNRHSKKFRLGYVLYFAKYGLGVIGIEAAGGLLLRALSKAVRKLFLGAALDVGLALVAAALFAVLIYICRQWSLSLMPMTYESMRPALLSLLRVTPTSAEFAAQAMAAQQGARLDSDRRIQDAVAVAESMLGDSALIFFSMSQIVIAAASSDPIVQAEAVG